MRIKTEKGTGKFATDETRIEHRSKRMIRTSFNDPRGEEDGIALPCSLLESFHLINEDSKARNARTRQRFAETILSFPTQLS